jgi:protein O-GlcNAc transferase
MELTIEQALQRAVEAHKAGKFKDAEALYRAILQAQSKHPDANHNLGVLAVSLNKPELALPLFKTALEVNSKQVQFWISYVDALIKTNQLEIAKSVLEQGKKLGLAGERVDALEAQLTPVTVVEKSESILQKQPSSFTQQRMRVSAEKKNSSSNQTNPNQVRSPSQLEIDGLLEHYQKGRYDLAENLAEDLVRKYPDNEIGWKALGAVFKQTGRLQESLTANQRAVEISTNDAEAHNNLGVTLQGLGKLEEAETSYKKAIAINPEYAEAHSNLGLTLQELGRLEEAKTSYKKAIAIKPEFAEAHSNLGITLKELGRLEEAETSYKKAIAIKPEYAKAHSNLGNTLKELGRLEEAETSYKKAIAMQPDYAEAHTNLGLTLQELGKLEEARTSYEKAIAIKPEYAEAHSNLGNALKELGRLEEAETSYEKAIAIKPEYAEAHYNLGITLQELDRLEEAEVSYKKAIEMKSYLAQAHCNLGNVLRELHRYAEAVKFTTKAIELNPKLAGAQQAHSAMLACLSDFSDVVEYSNAAVALKSDNPNIWESRLYCYIYHPDLSAQEICAEHVRWGMRFPTLNADLFDLHDRSPSRRLRVGYVSPDFRGHSCRFFFEPLFSQHNHIQFELFAYSNVLTEDEHTQRFKTYFDEWRNIRGVSDQEVVEMVRRDRIDILVDACGHMQNNRLAVFTYKPAPIQLTWEGGSWTTGLEQIDYVLFDPYMAPPGTLAIEEIVRLPKTRTVFRPGERALNEPVKSLPALKTGNITFGYSGRTERLNYKVFNAWGKIMERLPTAKLVLDYKIFSDVQTQRYYRDILGKYGIDVSRVTMRNSLNIFQGLGDIDILLDSFPHNGGTMLFDSLWMGVPALTLASRPPVGRIGASVMTNIGLSNWVAKDEYEYVDKAESFAKNIEELARLRPSMRERMKASPLMDEAGFARDVENAFQNMWHRWCSETKLSPKLSYFDEIKTTKSKLSSEQDE